METFFPNKCPTFVGGNVTNDNDQQKHDETTRRRTNHVMILIITRLLPHQQVLFLMILCFCVPFVCSSPKPFFVLHQRATTPSRSIFSLVLSTFRRTLHERHKIAQHTTHLVCFQKNDTNVSLLCVFLVFLSAKSSSVRFKKTLFRRKGKRTIKENETLLEPSRVQTRWMWMRRRSPDCVETEIRTWHQRQQQTPEWDDVFRSKTDGTRRDLFTSLC